MMLGWESWKPLIAALLLPPMPLFVLVLVGTRLVLRRRLLGWSLVLIAMALLYATSLRGTAVILRDQVLKPPPALTEGQVADLKRQQQTGRSTAIVVLGGGRRAFAPEFGTADLETATLERLRYGVWLARQTGAGLAFSGGIGWEAGGRQLGNSSEAEVASRVARTDLGMPLRWQEGDSRDTRENAILSVRMLQAAGVTRIVVVTHAWHMPRAMHQFVAAAAPLATAARPIEIVAAPMGQIGLVNRLVPDWLPSGEGVLETRRVLREGLAAIAGG